MGKIELLPWTTKKPLSMIGYCAGVCWDAPIDNEEKNVKRALSCIKAEHGRTLEYPDVYVVLTGWSARAMRELYTHIIGTTRLQESTRYVNYTNGIDYVTPPKIAWNDEAKVEYDACMSTISTAYNKLLEIGIPKEDAAMILPLGQKSKVVLKINARALIHFYEYRSCARAYWEIRNLANDLKNRLSEYSPEWKQFCDIALKIKCQKIGVCKEEHGCGRYKKSED